MPKRDYNKSNKTAHELDDTIHNRLRKVLGQDENGATTLLDHPLDGTSAYLAMVVCIEVGDAEPDASNYLDGTFLAVRAV